MSAHISRRTILSGIAGATVLTAGGYRKAFSQEVLTIGATLPITGNLAAAGQQQQNALLMAEEEINAAGGIGGKQLRIVVEDAQASNSSAVNAFIRLMREVNPPFMFLSSYTTQNLAVEQSVARAGIPCVYGGGGEAVANVGNKWLFRIRPEDSIQAKAMVDFGLNDLKAKKPAFIFVQNEFGQGVADSGTKLFKDAGIDVVAAESFRAGDSDFSAQILNVRNQGADLLFLVAYPREGALVLKQCHQLGFEPPIVTSSGVMLPAAIDLMEPAELSKVHGIVDVLLNTERGEEMARYVTTYQEKFGIRADAFGVCYYGAAHLLKQAIEAAGTEPEALRAYLAAVNGFQGIGQTFTADAKGNMVHSLDVVRFKDGTNVQEYIRTITA
jgi:branched-chain amino acid transport system substrate-binding protein